METVSTIKEIPSMMNGQTNPVELTNIPPRAGANSEPKAVNVEFKPLALETSSLAARLGRSALNAALTPVLALAETSSAMNDHHDGQPIAKLNEQSDITISSGGIKVLVLYLSASSPAQGESNTDGRSMQRKRSETPEAPAASLSLRTTANVVSALPRKDIPEAIESNCIFSHWVCLANVCS
jgi:hypothetical protein